MASIIPGEQSYLGGIFGAILIIIGLYLVLWGKSEEKTLGLLQAKSSMASENQPEKNGSECNFDHQQQQWHQALHVLVPNPTSSP